MSSANETSIGLAKDDLETPALCLDLDRYERNVARMIDFIGKRCGIAWRPHMKGQKAPQLAQRAIAAGAIGVTCATLYEAEAMAEAGVHGILIAHELAGERKLRRLARLQKLSPVIAATDSADHLDRMAGAARAEGVEIPVVIELNVGMNRSGIVPGQPALDLASRAHATAGIRFMGLMGWEGHVLQYEGDEKKRRTETSLAELTQTAELCRRAGLPVEIVSSSGSGTFLNAAHLAGITEVQAGGGVFSDKSYAGWGLEHEFALTLLTRVVSRPHPTRIIVDGGFKTMSRDHGNPEPMGMQGVKSISLSAEHGTIELIEPCETPGVNDIVEWIPGYTDSTVCLHDEMVVLRRGIVEEVWTIPGRSGRR
jgi:D-serine deaminase-like pyridoxal phosphate-dependent protein